jgi:hypothetical protein
MSMFSEASRMEREKVLVLATEIIQGEKNE